MLEKTLESPLDCKDIQPVHPKGNQFWILTEGLMLKLKLQYFCHLMWRTDSLEKNPDAGKDWRQEEKGTTEDEMVGWHHWLNGLEFHQASGVDDAIQPSHPLSSPSPPTFNLSQHQSFFSISQFFASGGQNIRVSALVSVLPMNIQDWFPLGWTGWISLQSKGLLRVFSNTTVLWMPSTKISIWNSTKLLKNHNKI